MRRSCAILMTVLLPWPVAAQEAYVPTPQNLGDRESFQDARFGLFVHWGVSSVLMDGEWVMENRGIRISEYERLTSEFDPTEFDADAWVSLAREAGIVRTRHRGRDGGGVPAARLEALRLLLAARLAQPRLLSARADGARHGAAPTRETGTATSIPWPRSSVSCSRNTGARVRLGRSGAFVAQATPSGACRSKSGGRVRTSRSMRTMPGWCFTSRRPFRSRSFACSCWSSSRIRAGPRSNGPRPLRAAPDPNTVSTLTADCQEAKGDWMADWILPFARATDAAKKYVVLGA